MYIESQRLFLRVVRGEFHDRSVRNDLFDDEIGVFGVKAQIAAKRRNEHVSAFGRDAGDMMRKNAAEAAVNC